MKTQQPEALRLADMLMAGAKKEADRRNSAYDVFGMDNTPENTQSIECAAAAELRRLHESNQELLAALKEVYSTCDWHGDDGREAMMKASAAINKAERTTT